MNLKKLLSVALAAVFLVSCTKEIIKEVPGGGGDEETGIAVVKLALDANMVQTRASAHGDLDPTAHENKIYNYGLFIFKSNGMLEATLINKSSELKTPLSPDAQGFLTFDPGMNPDLTWNEDGDAIIISSGMKTFFAIVNAPKEYVEDQGSFINNKTLTLDELKKITLELGGELTKIVGAYSNGTVEFNNNVSGNGVSGNGANRGFMMTNIVATGQSDGFYRERLEETEENDPPAEITVTVGRAMAKVSLASVLKTYTEIENNGQKDSNQPYGVLDPKMYKLINNPNEMNVALDISSSGVLTTPYFSNPTVTAANYFISNNTSHAPDYYIPVSTDSEQTFNYCIENANNTAKYGNAAIALIKGYFKPLAEPLGEAKIVNPSDLSIASLPLSGDFYRIWIEPYEVTENGVTTSLGGEYAEEYFVSKPSDTDLDYYISQKSLPITKDKLEVVFYKGGLCFYYLPLKNEKNEGSPYSVQRNSYYMIDITFVSGPGYPEDPDKPGEPGGPDKPGPEVPIEAQTEIKASIKVAQWDKVEQEGHL